MRKVVEKVKNITYIARDGQVCFSEAQCKEYENLLDIHDKYWVPKHHQEAPKIVFREIYGIEFFKVNTVEEFKELFRYFSLKINSAFSAKKWSSLSDTQIENEWLGKWFFPYVYYFPDSCHEVDLIHIEDIMELKEQEIEEIQKDLETLYAIHFNRLGG